MEIRRDPITQSWVVLGQREHLDSTSESCPFDDASVEKQPAILTWPPEGPWQVRVVPHPDPLYRIESEPGRAADGMYDKMGALGAHEVVVETRLHDKKMSQFSDEEIERVLWVWAARIADLKKDARFKYVAVLPQDQAPADRADPWRTHRTLVGGDRALGTTASCARVRHFLSQHPRLGGLWPKIRGVQPRRLGRRRL